MKLQAPSWSIIFSSPASPAESELSLLFLRDVPPGHAVLVSAPPLPAVGPGQLLRDPPEAGPDVDDAVGHDDVVVDGDDGAEDEHPHPHSCGDGGTSPQLEGAEPGKLTDGCLHVVHRLPHQHQDDEVGDEEGSPAILVCQVGKPPDVTNAHRVANTGEDELRLASPLPSVVLLGVCRCGRLTLEILIKILNLKSIISFCVSMSH